MQTKQVMAKNIVSVRPENSVRHGAQVMLDHDVSGLPVVDGDARLVGIVTEGDLLRRAELCPAYSLKLDSSSPPEQRARDYVKGHGWSIGDIMTRDVVTVVEDAPISSVAALMNDHGIKRVLVTRDGRLVGIVSRKDLLRAIVTAERDRTAPGDSAIRRAVLARLGEDSGLECPLPQVTVLNGVVSMHGTVGSESQREAARVAAETVRGVIGVANNLRILSGAAASDGPGTTPTHV
jgi:CBS domain-containing protein